MLVSYPDVLSPGGGTRSTSRVVGPWLGASGHRRLGPRKARRSQGCARDDSAGVAAVVAAAPRHRGRAVRFLSCPLVGWLGGFAAL